MRSALKNVFTGRDSELQTVEMVLGEGEAVIAESGALMYMEQGIFHEVMEENLSNRSKWRYVNHSHEERRIAFCAPHPDRILPIDLRQYNDRLLCHSKAFLCTAKGVSVDISFQKNFWTGQYGDDALTMETLAGDGLVYLRSSGPAMCRELATGEVLRVDSRCLVAITTSVDYDIQKIGGAAADDEGEQVFFTSVSGPGMIWLQTAPYGR